MTQPIILQRIEGAIAFAASIWLYHLAGGDWWLFALLLLAVDISMVGYLRGPRLGALTYNLGHSYLIPGLIALLCLIFTGHMPTLLYIWFAHIGMDRALGYGLKEDAGFKHTHLGHIGKK
jgi:phosphatidylserine synthase